METLKSGLTPHFTATCSISASVSPGIFGSRKFNMETPQLMSPVISHWVSFPLLSRPYLLSVLFSYFTQIRKYLHQNFPIISLMRRRGSKDDLTVGRGKVGVLRKGHPAHPLEAQLLSQSLIFNFTSRKSIIIFPLTPQIQDLWAISIFLTLFFAFNGFVTCKTKLIIQRQLLQLKKKKKAVAVKKSIGRSSKQTWDEMKV